MATIDQGAGSRSDQWQALLEAFLREARRFTSKDPSDLAQKAFCRLWQNDNGRAEIERRGDALLPMLRKTMSRLLKDDNRGRRARKRAGTVPLGEYDPISEDTTPYRATERGCRDRFIREAIDKLHDPREATVVTVCYLQGGSVADAARSLGLDIEQTKRILAKARAKLRQALRHSGDESWMTAATK